MKDMKYMLQRLKEEKLKSQITTMPIHDINITLSLLEKMQVLFISLLAGAVIGASVWIGANWLIRAMPNLPNTSARYSANSLTAIIITISLISGFIAATSSIYAYKNYKLKIKRLKAQNKILQDGEDEIDNQLKSAMLNGFNCLLQDRLSQKETIESSINSAPSNELTNLLLPHIENLYKELKVENPILIKSLEITNQKQIPHLIKHDPIIKKYIETEIQPIVNEYVMHRPIKEHKLKEKKPGLANAIIAGLISFLEATGLILAGSIGIAAISLGGVAGLTATLLTTVIGGSLLTGSVLIGLAVGTITSFLEQKSLYGEAAVTNRETKQKVLLEWLSEFKDELNMIVKSISNQQRYETDMSNQPLKNTMETSLPKNEVSTKTVEPESDINPVPGRKNPFSPHR